MLCHDERSREHSVQRRRAGAEAAFGAYAERRGVEEVNFTFDGHKIVRHRGVRVLNHEELQAAMSASSTSRG